jgi:hypothetical protein
VAGFSIALSIFKKISEKASLFLRERDGRGH